MDASRTALLLLNFQNEFLKPDGLMHRAFRNNVTDQETSTLLSNAISLVDAARSAGMSVVWVNTALRPDALDSALSPAVMQKVAELGGANLLADGSWGAQVVDELTPATTDVIVVKKGHSAFQSTTLDRTLTNLGVGTCIVVGGGMLDDLVQTLNEGGALGFEMIVPVDATDPSAQPKQRMWRTRASLTSTDELAAEIRTSRSQPAVPSETALIVIDLQNDFVHPQGVRGRLGYSKMTEEERSILIENNQALCDAMRQAGHPVIFARVGVRKDNLDRAWSKSIRRELPIEQDEGYLAEGSWGAQVVEGVDTVDSDIMVTKKGNSAFGLTPLHRILRNLNVSSCVVSGGAVHGCIEATVREGVGLGYSFTVVPDAAYPPNSLVADVLANQTAFKTTAEVIDQL